MKEIRKNLNNNKISRISDEDMESIFGGGSTDECVEYTFCESCSIFNKLNTINRDMRVALFGYATSRISEVPESDYGYKHKFLSQVGTKSQGIVDIAMLSTLVIGIVFAERLFCKFTNKLLTRNTNHVKNNTTPNPVD